MKDFERFKKLIEKKMTSKNFADHKAPVTRRDFLKLGLLSGTASFFPLTLTQKLHAMTNPSLIVPFLTFDLEGGASLPGNFLVGQKDGAEDLCDNYKLHGWNPRANDSLDKTYGAPMSKQRSQMLAGLNSALPDFIKNQTPDNRYLVFSTICNASLNDVSINKLSVAQLVNASGLKGSVIKNGLRMSPAVSGYYSDEIFKSDLYRPQLIGSSEKITDLSVFSSEFANLDSRLKNAIFERLIAAGSEYSELKQAYSELSELGLPHINGIATDKSEVLSAYDNFQSDLDAANVQSDPNRSQDLNQLRATIAYNTLLGYTGPGAFTFAGCDYHDDTSETGDSIDFTIGRAIGQAVHLAHLLNKPLFIHMISDGGVQSAGSSDYDRIWRSDKGEHGLTVMAYFNPNGAIKTNKLQLGHYTANAVTDSSVELGKTNEGPQLSARMVYANYLSVNGMLSEFQNLSNIRVDRKTLNSWTVYT